jgi:hypothetical protein
MIMGVRFHAGWLIASQALLLYVDVIVVHVTSFL